MISTKPLGSDYTRLSTTKPSYCSIFSPVNVQYLSFYPHNSSLWASLRLMFHELNTYDLCINISICWIGINDLFVLRLKPG